jgi:hypothetical protein
MWIFPAARTKGSAGDARVISDRSHLPLEVVKLGESREIAPFRCDHANAESPGAHSDQRIIGQLSNLPARRPFAPDHWQQRKFP